ncbi:glutathione S-transferase [Colwellia sp. 6M3]|jgi:glutathione S-transferase|uniref:glutathione S-transferase n=1 Tax=Colwellia sp. 6M3 TaxID=2759849 RepID=UPI0015F606DD|nr:glutathione S-transferase [Colwellia sp. 6M3]MBA6416419.1 glutathione S-transferase [Colwellia sp. 6M3]
MALPILYSLRNCPYAMRARIAIFKSHQPVALRDVVLSDKPPEMILASAKATVPILVISQTDNSISKENAKCQVIDESLDVMLWALNSADPNDLLHRDSPEVLTQMLAFITEFDVEFKRCLEAYKCAKRYHETNIDECRAACEHYIQMLELRLTAHKFLSSERESLLDIALLPFIRQFARIERQWYLQSPYPNLKAWLNNYLQSPMFTKVMAKYPLWLDSAEKVVFVGK